MLWGISDILKDRKPLPFHVCRTLTNLRRRKGEGRSHFQRHFFFPKARSFAPHTEVELALLNRMMSGSATTERFAAHLGPVDITNGELRAKCHVRRVAHADLVGYRYLRPNCAISAGTPRLLPRSSPYGWAECGHCAIARRCEPVEPDFLLNSPVDAMVHSPLVMSRMTRRRPSSMGSMSKSFLPASSVIR